MESFKNLYEFVEHCEDVILQSKEDDKEEFAILAIMAQANYTNQERLLIDAQITLTFYYQYLLEAIQQELYNFAAIIVKAKNIEVQHYTKLSITIIPDDAEEFKKNLIALDLYLNNEYLSND